MTQPAVQPDPVTQWQQPGELAKGPYPEAGSDTVETIKYCKVKVLQGGGTGMTEVTMEDARPHIERLAQPVSAKLSVPKMGENNSVAVTVLLDSGSGVTAISEALLEEMQKMVPGATVSRPFVGQARVETATGEVRDV